MKIHFTEQEYRLLLDAVVIADSVLTSHRPDHDLEHDSHQMLFQKLYSHAREMDCGELVEAVKETNRYRPSRRFEAESQAYDRIEEYDDLTFWNELIERLAERDLYKRHSHDAVDRLSSEEYRRRSAPYERRYRGEFENHGIDRLAIGEG